MNIGLFILIIYIFAIMQMHYRGKVRFSVPRQALTHTNYLAPYNLLMNLFSKLKTDPIIKVDDIEELKLLRDNWQTIRDEALQLADKGAIKKSDKLNDVGFNSFFRTGWTRFYLKWYGDPLPSALRDCPKTVALLEQVPGINAAMFASLPPGGVLSPHRDPYAGSLRYHLGLSTPNSDDCYILVDGERHSWRDGQDVLFDETYIHEAHNNTDQMRIILFCDVHRPMRFAPIDRFNRWVSRVLMSHTVTENEEGERVGAVNRAFSHVHGLRVYARRFKKWNKPLYVATKYFLYFGLIYLLFF